MKKNESFKALRRMCLNNWHYIDQKILKFNQEINFFTGHSGSGKSTIIDALQIVLYANTDGRGFFNKAAADDSDRSLIEYLRGMINIGENNEFSYLRNKNFSTTIVLELQRTDTEESECIGVCFDVVTATNEVTRLFFHHHGPLPEHGYRTEERAMTTEEIKAYLRSHFQKDEFFCGSHNERFRRQLYDVYLGGLDMEKFPLLFKRAIPFRMNSKLEDFVKEYICMEQDIHIEDMQESVMQYGRMQKKIEDTRKEIELLKEIGESYELVREKEEEARQYAYFEKKTDFLLQKEFLKEQQEKKRARQEELERLNREKEKQEEQIKELEKRREELVKSIAETGYEELKHQLKSMNDLLERLYRSKARWDQTGEKLKKWAEEESATNDIVWNAEKFRNNQISGVEIRALKEAIKDLQEEISAEKKELDNQIREWKKEQKEIKEELFELSEGRKAYPKEVREAKQYLIRLLAIETGRNIKVDILADLLEVKDEKWQNAVEGYLGSQKLSLVVEPAYVKSAMEIYRKMDQKRFFRVSILDTEKLQTSTFTEQKNSLAEEVEAKEDYVNSYLKFLLGNVIKCETEEELRKQKIGVTPDCMQYRGFKLQHMNPDNYTKFAYIGVDSMKRRMKQLKQQEEKVAKKLVPAFEKKGRYDRLLSMESLSHSVEEYQEWQKDMEELKVREKEKSRLKERLMALKELDVDRLEEEKKEIGERLEKRRENLTHLVKEMGKKEDEIRGIDQSYLSFSEALLKEENEFETTEKWEDSFTMFLERKEKDQMTKRWLDGLKSDFSKKAEQCRKEGEEQKSWLYQKRHLYLQQYPNRSFDFQAENNEAYDKLLSELECDDLGKYQSIAREMAKSAAEHFKDDFIFKIRSAIKEAMMRKDELNRIIHKLDFGKDKYQFIFTKNKGEDGKYFDMFMDDSLEVNPKNLSDSMEEQANLFTMAHENQYGELMNELISVFIPPEDATEKELEEARRNMEHYADYRSYLSFDMEQTIEGEEGEPIKIRLSKMLKKNSGGEGQNPLYVALLASFAQAYRIGMPPKMQRNPTIRLVVLDEAFSKMDGEKVASCIRLIRDLGFQVIISATNDKIQNYLENVDKTFVFANPNKKSISIQEFEKNDFYELSDEIE